MWPVNDDDMMSEETVLNPIGRSTLVGRHHVIVIDRPHVQGVTAKKQPISVDLPMGLRTVSSDIMSLSLTGHMYRV